ncbi:hypothetical protein IMG5_022510 [Ichthyophthirius multifiliis]|uniref:ABC transporter domain-containing protein n=1 Tax=Ichthyophthirius multifiliis TaxID=5932 RepID=G0QKV2_ICHMU|nr:hypothetical protein IMG5_022510 [Ichthyophthirius multifiliis]EGR34152.1 hypothetical protein IMG5_022510 [Ichthyophthirius multifiliis]|eukprot:XP_004039456.1 hypothetical protein IMG5_022510 [Ichthyophthirius multifiliis]
MAASMLVFDCFLYLGFYFYLNEVLPGEYGVQKKKNFNKMQENKNEKNKYFIDKSSAQFHEKHIQNGNLICKIQNLNKKYGKFKALDNIYLNLYENEIFCLLGHNGAGKTTTISVLTGLLQKTGGNIQIFGKELEENIDEIRQNIGFCSQKDILYEDLNVFEQLEYTGNIKGIPRNILYKEIERIGKDVGIFQEMNKLTKHLSGGNKRKVSLANALIGGSKLIFLDEPTSGMDAVSRQEIWNILENIKKEEKKCIVLTTHYLEEAEKLAQRIAILENGKLLVMGTSEFIKETFGVGYHLSIECQNFEENKCIWEKEKDIISQKILKEINGSYRNFQCANFQLKFVLPFKQLEKFSSLLDDLQKKELLSISIEMNSLEDAFIQIGQKNITQEQYINNQIEDIQFFQNQIYKKNQFLQQMIAFAKRQFLVTYRNWTAILMLILPILFNFFGVYLSKNILTNLQEILNLDQDISKEYLFPLKMYFLTIFIVQAYSMNTSIYINTPVLEEELQIMYILRSNGIKISTYWLGTFIVDYFSYLLTLVIFIYSLYVYQIDFLEEQLGKLSVILCVFGISLILFSYLCSFLFSKSSQAFKSFPIYSFFICYSIPWVILQITKEDFKKVNAFLEILCVFFSPFLMLQKALENLQNFEWKKQVFFFFFQSFFYVFFIYKISLKKISKIRNKKTVKNNLNLNNDNMQEPEIIKETKRIKKYENQDTIKAFQIHKKYPNGFHAVKGNSFGVQKGEIFGLLGPNGAGKSSTFKLITGNDSLSAGNIELEGKNIEKIGEEPIGGICSQEDCFWEFLTVKEHLEIYGRINGFQGKALEKIIQNFIKKMSLENFENIKAGVLSGGNKRKLSVCCAILGNKKLLFFDEPSCGMDPVAKRVFWDILRENLGEKSAVLTTHSLQEAEVLCGRIAIQVNGQFVCFGSLKELRDRFGNGQKIGVKMNFGQQQNVQFVKKMIFELFGDENVKILQDFEESIFGVEGEVFCLNFQIKQNLVRFSKIFQVLYNQLVLGGIILDFSIKLTSLEDIFLYFSQFQINNNQQN